MASGHKQMLVVLGLWLLLSAPMPALAEGRCPPGQYPIGGQGVGGCAPIPGADGGSTAEPKPTGRWIKTWGAVATSPSGDAGAAKDKLSKSEATKEATAQCSQWGATDCKVALTYKNQCVAAVAADKGLGTKLSTGGTIEKATEFANLECKKSGSQTCKVIYTACTEPYFEKF